MRYKFICPKYYYYGSIIGYGAGTLFLAYLYAKSFASQEMGVILFLGTLGTFLFFWLLYFVSKFIYAKVDQDLKIIIYGNLYFHQEAKLEDVKYLGKFLFTRRILKLEIAGKRWNIACLEYGLDEMFK